MFGMFYRDVKMFLLKLGSELQNLVKKFQFAIRYKQNTVPISTKWNAHRSVSSPKRPILNRVKKNTLRNKATVYQRLNNVVAL